MAIFVEGQTEETFVKQVLNRHLAAHNLTLEPRFPGHRRGSVSYADWNRDIRASLHQGNIHRVTTMLDFHGIHSDFPQPQRFDPVTVQARVSAIELSWNQEIGSYRFLPYIACHEFEAMLFADPNEIARAFPNQDIALDLRRIRQRFVNPEEINDNTHPSQHIRNVVGDEYQKPLHGTLIAEAISLERIRAECPHFNSWIQHLEALGESSG